MVFYFFFPDADDLRIADLREQVVKPNQYSGREFAIRCKAWESVVRDSQFGLYYLPIYNSAWRRNW